MTNANLQSHDWRNLAPGFDVLMRPDDSNDIVALIVFSPVGSAVESAADAGTLSFAARMLLRGTRRLSNADLAEAIDSLGISLAIDVGEDYTDAHIVSTSETLEESIALLAETFFEPAFEPEEIEKERQSTLASIRRSEDDLFSLTLQKFYREIYPDHGYGLPGIGLKESVGELTRDQLISAHEEITGGPFRAVAVGNFDPDQLSSLLQHHFAARVKPQENGTLRPVPPVASDAHQVTFGRDSEQAYLVMGYPAVPPSHPDYFAARLLNAILGEGMSSRLFTALREEKGLAYATGSSYSAHQMAGQMFGYIGTKPESLVTAREGMLAEFERIKTEPIPRDEFERARNYLVGKFLIDHQKNYRRAFYLGHFDQLGLGSEMDDRYADLVGQVTPEQVQQIARQILTRPVIVELVPNPKAD